VRTSAAAPSTIPTKIAARGGIVHRERSDTTKEMTTVMRFVADARTAGGRQPPAWILERGWRFGGARTRLTCGPECQRGAAFVSVASISVRRTKHLPAALQDDRG
jgi:hypothetical protein